ncbi:MAG: hypothetical protein KKB13_26880, partial [Chloroflexi bacterium]|nr:hypothetical protein [Chloroflexota bacterium]
AERVVVADHDQVQDFALEPLPCILLVDDDNDAPDVRPYYIAALDSLGYDYDVFDVGGGAGNGPSLAEMTGYTIVIWFSGDKYGSGDSAGPNAADEANLTAYLDGGGRLFLSSQDYLYDMGLTAFGQDYLGVGSHTSDAGDATAKYGVAGDPVGAGLGPYTLTYPPDFSDYGDIVNAGTGASVAFQSAESGGNNLDVDRDGGNWQTVFFGTSWVPIYTHSAANGQQVLQRIVEWLGGCGCTVLTGVTLAQTTPGPVYPGDAVAFSAGTAPADAHKPYSYRLTVDGVPGPVQSSSANPLAFSRTFATTGTHQVAIAAWNCVLTEPDAVTDVVQVEVACRELSGVTIAGASSGTPGAYTFIAAYAPANAMPPISYQWDNGDATAASVRTLGLGTHTLAVTATNCAGALVTDTHIVVISPVCTPALAVDLVLGTAGIVYTDTVAQFRASIVPADASPYTYVVYANGAVIIGPHTGSANPLAFTHVFGLAGAYTVEVRVEDCSLVAPVSDAVVVTVRRGDWYYAYLPLVLRDE